MQRPIAENPLVKYDAPDRIVTTAFGEHWHLHGSRIARPDFRGHCGFCTKWYSMAEQVNDV